MKKLKKFWQENSVLLVLLLILIACLIAISVVVFTYFIGTNNSKYGDRLEGIENYPFKEEQQDELAEQIKADEAVDNVQVETSGKRIIVTIKFKGGTMLEDAKSKALSSLELIDEKLLTFYDVEYQIEAPATDNMEGFKLAGSHNVKGTGGIVWVNNQEKQDEAEEK